jgi:hypothetical protein
MSDEMEAALAVGGEVPGVVVAGRRREQDSTRRTLRLTPRFSVCERAEIEVAAASVGRR